MSVQVNQFDLEDLALGEGNIGRADASSLAVLEFLKDGEWHSREEVIRQVAHRIPHGQGYRRAVQTYKESYRNRLVKRGVPLEEAQQQADDLPDTAREDGEVDTDFLVKSGRRAILMDAVNSSVRIEKRKDENGAIWLRRHSNHRYTQTQSYKDRMALIQAVLDLVGQQYDVRPKKSH